jgi:hypothetical protein
VKKLILVIAMSAISCAGSTLGTGVKTGGKIALQCGEESLKARASTILPSILAILAMASDEWKKQADMYVANYGKDVTICAARTALDKLTAPVQSEGLVADPEVIKKTATARLRAMEIEANVE